MFLLVLFCVNSLYHVNGASYSNVYLQSDLGPRGFYQYGTPHASLASPRLSQINTLPALPGYVPCGTPCVYPGQTVATVASVNPQPNVLTYGAPVPSVPVVVTPTKEEAAAYEYGYVVYDDNTGDHKAQRELSDGSVVRGEYSFIQPDGYIREVQYQADDISGFNAIVKNFLPAVAEGKDKVEKKESSPPCPEIKHASLIESNTHQEHGHKNVESVEHEHSKSEESAENEHSKEMTHHGHNVKESKEDSGEKSHEHVVHSKHEQVQHPSKAISKEDSSEESEEKSKEALHVKPKESEEKHHKAAKSSEEESGVTSESKESKEELKEKLKKHPGKKPIHPVDKHVKESKEVSVEVSKEESHESHKHKEVHDLSQPDPLAPYSDIIRCIESVMKRNSVVPGAHEGHPSPLTYIVLKKPC